MYTDFLIYRWIVFLVLLASSLGYPAVGYAQTVTSEVTVSVIIPAQNGSVRLTGFTAPGSLVTVLEQGVTVGTTITGSDSVFTINFSAVTPGVHSYSLFATDPDGRHTQTITITITSVTGTTVTVSNIVLPPTLTVNKNPLRRPDFSQVTGYARANARVTHLHLGHKRGDERRVSVTSDSTGRWTAKLAEILHLEGYDVSATVESPTGSQSSPSQTLPLTVVLSADLNLDERVNLVDFSILMFNYGQSRPANPAADINDNCSIYNERCLVDLVDFSIMMFYWTGD